MTWLCVASGVDTQQGSRVSKSQWHDPTDWVIANYPWPAAACTASGATESGRPPSLLRLRPEDFGVGLAAPLSRQVPTPAGVDGQAASLMTEQRHINEQSVEDDERLLLDHHHQQQQQQQQLGNDDDGLIIDPLVFCQSYLYS